VNTVSAPGNPTVYVESKPGTGLYEKYDRTELSVLLSTLSEYWRNVMQMQIYKVRKKQALGAAVLSKTGVSSITSGTPGKYVQSHVDGEIG